MRARSIICLVICCFFGGLVLGAVGSCVLQNRCNRSGDATTETIQHNLEENKQLIEEYNNATGNYNRAAATAVESMGQQLESDTGTITDTAGEIKALRADLQNLKNYYTSNSNSNSSGNNMDTKAVTHE